MYIYKLICFSYNEDDNEYNAHGYLISDKLYSKEEFLDLCKKCETEVERIYKEVCVYTMKQHMILHYGFKELEIIQSYGFNEKY